MRKSSWIILGICAALIAGLVYAYATAGPPAGPMTRPQAVDMLHTLQKGVAQKHVGLITGCISPAPDVVIANLHPEQLRYLLVRAFRNSGKLHAECNNISFTSTDQDATVGFDLLIQDIDSGMIADDYTGRVTLRLRRVDVSHLLGLYHTKEWLVVSADTTGKDPGTYGDM